MLILAGRVLGAALPSDAARVAYWPADGDAVDKVGGFSGELVSSVTFQTGIKGSTFGFSGNGTAVRIPYAPALVLKAYTYSAWVKPKAMPVDPVYANQNLIVGQAVVSGMGIRPGVNGVKLVAWVSPTPYYFPFVSSVDELPLDRYSHVAATYDGATLKIYINGVFQGRLASTAYTPTVAYDFFIGGFSAQSGYPGQYFNGDIDEVAIHGQPLTEAEVRSLYFSQIAGEPPAQIISFRALADRKITNTPVVLEAFSSSGLPVSFRVVSGPALINGDKVILTGAGFVEIEASQPGDGAFSAAPPVRQSFTVSLLDQSIFFPFVQSKLMSDSPFRLSATAGSGLPVIYSVVSGPATVSGNLVTLLGAGNVTIRATQPGDATYSPATPVDRTFNVGKDNQVISFGSISSKSLDIPVFEAEASANSGLPVVFSIVSGPASVSGRTITLTGPGNVIVRASQPGNDAFNPATPVDRSFVVFKSNTPPVFAGVPGEIITVNQTPVLISFRLNDTETPDGPFGLQFSSSNIDLIPEGAISITQDGASGTLRLTAAKGRFGKARVRLTAVDSFGAAASSEFDVVVRHGPALAPVQDWIVDQNALIGPIKVELADRGDLGATLNWAASSSNPELIPADRILISAQASSCTFVLAPATDRSGEAIITVRVGDGQLSAETQFKVTVRRPNQPPTISDIANLSVISGQTIKISFNVSDAESSPERLLVRSASARSDLIPNGNIIIAGVGLERTASFTAIAGREGLCPVTLTVTDEGGLSSSVTFTVQVRPAVNLPPTITLLAPLEGGVFDEGKPVEMFAQAADPEGQVARVEFFDGETRLAEVLAAPYRIATSALAAGPHVITARVVDGAGNFAVTPPIAITVRKAAPANDSFAARSQIGSLPILASTALATREPGEPLHGGVGSGPSIWYSWSSPLDARIKLSTLGSSFDTVLAVYRGDSLDGLTQLASNDDDAAGGLTSALTFTAKGGVGYVIAVAGSAGASGEVKLDLSVVEVVAKPLQVQQSGQNIVLSWPVDLAGAVVETTAGLSADGSWLPVPPPATTVDGNYYLKVTVLDDIRFYRLRVTQ